MVKRVTFISLTLFFIVFGMLLVSTANYNPTEELNKSVQENKKIGVILSDYQINRLVNKFFLEKNTKEYNKILAFYTDITKDEYIADTIIKYSLQYNVPISLSMAMCKRESNFNPKAYNENLHKKLSPPSVDRGLFMLNNYSHKNMTKAQMYDVESNVREALSMMHVYLEKYEDNELMTEIALACYNEGENIIVQDILYFSTSLYIFKIRNTQHDYNVLFNKKMVKALEGIDIFDFAQKNP